MRGKKGGEILSENWGGGAVGPVMFAFFLGGVCSRAIPGRSVWQGNLILFFLTLSSDACCERLGFHKMLLRFAFMFLIFVAS